MFEEFYEDYLISKRDEENILEIVYVFEIGVG